MINAFISAYHRYINILWTTWALLLLLGVGETGICTWKSDNLNPTSNSFFFFATPNFISYLSNITAINQGINPSPIKTIIIINSKAQNNRPHQKKSVYLQQKNLTVQNASTKQVCFPRLPEIPIRVTTTFFKLQFGESLQSSASV